MKFKALFLVLVLALQHTIALAVQLKAKVIGIKDGDTIEILIGTTSQVIRLEHIDCPEKKQAFGNAAKQAIAKYCFGKMVIIQHNNKFDRNKRLIAEVILPENNLNVNLKMVTDGYAWHFKKYSKDNRFANAELLARRNRVGLWFDKNPMAPWDWRKLPKEEKILKEMN
jgi:micrococcal nuclease